MLEVVKRDGTQQTFNSRKIGNVLGHVLDGKASISIMTERVIDTIGNVDSVSVSSIQDIIEAELIDSGFPNEARSFIRYRAERDLMRDRRGAADIAAFADSIVASKYTRWSNELERREEWDDAVDRMMDMHLIFWVKKMFGEHVRPSEASKVLDDEDYQRFQTLSVLVSECRTAVKNRLIVGSMRALQMGGSKILKHNDSIYNCTFTHISSFEAIVKSFFRLLCGCGVGYSIQYHHVDQLSSLNKIDTGTVHHHTVVDSIEGWADSLMVLFDSYTQEGKNSYIEYDYSQVRGEGSRLATTGGTAPGHLGLKKGIEAIRSVLESCHGRLRPIHCHDIMCWMASAVLSGGVRRSAMLALFSPNDGEMMMAKSPGYFSPQVPGSSGLQSQREFANNSACLLRSRVEKGEFSRVLGLSKDYGDPGFYLTDDMEYGPNPCGEINMLPLTDGTDCIESKQLGLQQTESGFGFCNLTEINGSTIDSADDFHDRCRLASALGTLQAGYTDFKYLGGSVDASIADRDALLGVSIAGIMNKPDILLDANILTRGAEIVNSTNASVSKMLGIRSAARTTCVKPSGTASKALSVGGTIVGAGIHALWSRRWIQGVTYKASEPVLQHILKYSPIQVTYKPNGDAFVEWPLSVNDSAITMKDVDAITQLENISLVYKAWVLPGTVRGKMTHNVSCTVTVKNHEWGLVEDWIWSNRSWLAALTFVPDLLEIRFPYAPYRSVHDAQTEGRYDELIRKMKPIDWKTFTDEMDVLDGACAGGACLV